MDTHTLSPRGDADIYVAAWATRTSDGGYAVRSAHAVGSEPHVPTHAVVSHCAVIPASDLDGRAGWDHPVLGDARWALADAVEATLDALAGASRRNRDGHALAG